MTTSTVNTIFEFGFDNENSVEDEFLLIEFQVKTDSKDSIDWLVNEEQEKVLHEMLNQLDMKWQVDDTAAIMVEWTDSQEDLVDLLEENSNLVYRPSLDWE